MKINLCRGRRQSTALTVDISRGQMPHPLWAYRQLEELSVSWDRRLTQEARPRALFLMCWKKPDRDGPSAVRTSSGSQVGSAAHIRKPGQGQASRPPTQPLCIWGAEQHSRLSSWKSHRCKDFRKQIPHVAAGDVSTTEEIELGDTAESGRGPGYSEWLGEGP